MLAFGYFDLYTPRLSIRSMQHLPCFITDRGLDRLNWLSRSPGQRLNPLRLARLFRARLLLRAGLSSNAVGWIESLA
jgi:hypothetical protein